MHFPPLNFLAKAVAVAAILGVLGYALPATLTGNAHLDNALLLFFGAFVGALLSGLRFSEGATAETAEAGELQTIFVGNLAFKATDEELRELFAPYGQVQASRIMRDRKTRRPRGFGFVEMPQRQAQRAIKALDGKEFRERKLRVRAANVKDAGDDNRSA